MRYGRSMLLTLSVVAGLPSVAAAATVNFAALQTMGTPDATLGGLRSLGSSLSFGGLDFSSTDNQFFALSVWDDANAHLPLGGTASTSLFEYAQNRTTTIQLTGGGLFELQGIDLANFGTYINGFPTSFLVTFTGTRADSSTVTQTFTVANSGPAGASPILQSFLFTDFDNLVSVSVTQGTYVNGNAFQFNNLVYRIASDTAVPEPTSLVLLGTGLAVAVVRLRRRSGMR